MAGTIIPILWIQTLGQGEVKRHAEHHKDLISSSGTCTLFMMLLLEGKCEVVEQKSGIKAAASAQGLTHRTAFGESFNLSQFCLHIR